MFKNYFETALRNLIRHKGYSLINITGLAIGMACCLLIFMFVTEELSYDNYSQYADRIVRVAGAFKYGGREFNMATVPAPMAKTLVNDYPEVEDAVRFRRRGSYILKYGENSFKEQRFVFSDATLFKIFGIPLLKGDPETALKEPNSLVLSKKTAKKYFGTQNAIGKIIKVDNKDDYKVTGVFEKIPGNSHFHFDVIASLESLQESREQVWLSNNFNTYLLLGKHTDPKALEAKFPEFIKKYFAPQVEKFLGQSLEKLVASGNASISFYLQPLRRIHLYSDLRSEMSHNSDIKYIYIFSAIALFILIIAAINFMNLSTARSAGRAREVGIRKVVGSARGQLVRQFLIESMILSVISMSIALVLIKLVLPFFNSLSGKEFVMSNFYHWEILLVVIAVTLLTGIFAGLYPAFLISAFQPISVLKGQLKSGVKSGWLRSGLVVFQFAASIILIISTMVVMNQLKYIQEKKLGFNKEEVLILQNAYLLDKQAEAFKNELLTHPQIKSATISSYLPVPSNRNSTAVFPEGQVANKNSTSIQNWDIDYDYFKTLGINIIKGRNFSREFSTDDSAAIINQQAAKQFGWQNPIGKKLSGVVSLKGDMKTFTVIGMVEDFHFESLRSSIGPMVLFLEESKEFISFRIDTHDIPGTINLLRSKWDKFLPGQPFAYWFLDERFNNIYQAEQQLGNIFGVFTLLAIFIGCLGLFGLAAFISEQRTKEIGVRKVLGASVSSIIRLLSREFVILVGIANVVAWPIAYVIMKQWLQDFAYRASLTITIFIVSGVMAVVIALLTTGYQAIKAALSDPVKSLKYE